MLYGADLPTEGVLADEVRSATLRGDGPGRRHSGRARRRRARCASTRWRSAAPPTIARCRSSCARRCAAGAIAAASALAVLLLLWAGRGRGLLWWPVALAPAAVALLVPALCGEPVGLLFLSLLVGRAGGGGVGRGRSRWRRGGAT